MTSEGGVRAYPGIGAYHASKWALEGLSESLAQEVAGFGIHVTRAEPGPYATEAIYLDRLQTRRDWQQVLLAAFGGQVS